MESGIIMKKEIETYFTQSLKCWRRFLLFINYIFTIFLPFMNTLSTVIPEIAARVQLVLDEMSSLGHPMAVNQGYRTWQQQADLYAIGRTKEKNRGTVTNALPGQSLHNYACAVDCNFTTGDPFGENQPWGLYGEVAKKYGFEWGGDWTTPVDRPHIQMAFGYTWKQLKDMGEHNAVAELQSKARSMYPIQPVESISEYAQESFKKAEKLGFTTQNPREEVMTRRGRKILVKMGFPIQDNDSPVVYEDIIHMFDKAGIIDDVINDPNFFKKHL